MRVDSLRALVCVLLWCGCTEVEPRAPAPTRRGEAAVGVPPRFTDTVVAEDLDGATSMAIAPDGRIFVCEQGGRLRVIQGGKLQAEPFLTVDTDSDGERGLLGVAFDPGFPAEPYVYIYYTATTPNVHNRLSRFTANGNRAVAGSERILLELETLAANNHNGGALHFGLDGKLYVAVGDNARSENAKKLDTLKGKVLRLEKDGSIPSDNPFLASTTGVNRAIWALGLRNPFSFAVQPGTGRIFINDVGQSEWEEINEGVAGAHYGWPDTEGPTSDSRYRAPLFAYRHGSGTGRGCAITGGVFYNPASPQFPAEYAGRYFFSDYCNGWIRTFDAGTGTVADFATGLEAPVDIDLGPDGSLYYLDRQDDAVHRIRYTAANEAPTLSRHPEDQTAMPGQSVTFEVSTTGTTPLRYQWQRGGADLPGETAASLTLPSVALTDSGARFRVRVANDFGSALSNEAVLTVKSNTLPTATITAPAEGTLYRAGDVLRFEGETSANVWYRIHLSVVDSSGATQEATRDVHPRKVKLRVDTGPAGLQVTLEGQPRTSPVEVESVVGLVRTLGVVSPQVKDGTTYVFDHWSDGGSTSHDIPTPAADTRYTAVFRAGDVPGTGLKAEYFDEPDLTGKKLERVDPTVDFRWEDGSPDPALGKDTFSVRWTGSLVPAASGTYTFHTQTNDGVRLWVDGQLLIDDWTVHSTQENRATLALEAGRAYSLRMEFFERTGLAVARLLWSSPSQDKGKKRVIPQERLRPTPP